MRRIRSRRRFKLLLTIVLIACITLFAEKRIEAFVPQVKSFAELRMEESLGGNVKFTIGSIDGGILRPIVLNDIKIVNGKEARLEPSLDIASIKTNYRIWDIFYKIKDEKYSSVRGVLDTSFAGKIIFSGSARAGNFDICLESRKGIVRAQGKFSDGGAVSVDLKAEHLKLGDFDIVCGGRASISAQPGPSGLVYRGEFETKNLVVNYKPFPDLKVIYAVDRGTLNIDDARIGDLFRLAGRVLLNYPNSMDMTLTANNVSLSWLFISIGSKDAGKLLTGTMNGRFVLRGPSEKLKMDARIDIRKGTMAELDFEALSATLKGDMPYLRIEDARITRQSGFFTLEGEMDLRKIGKSAFFDNIRLSSDDKAINWDGWNSSKVQDVSEFRMKKRINDDINIDFKKFVAEEKVDESIKDNDEVGLEYKLHPNDSLKMVVGKDREFLGLEHKDKF